MVAAGPSEKGRLPVAPKHLCPFLALRYDLETYSASGGRSNYCHKAAPVAPVTIERQILTCCSIEYQTCPVFIDPQAHRLPDEWVDQDVLSRHKKRSRWGVLVYIGIGLAVLALAALSYWGGWFGFLTTPQPPAALPTNTSTETIAFTATLTLTNTPTPRPTRTSTATPTETGTPTPQPPTPGPALETPFGAPLTFLVHEVLEGESLNVIAAQYQTTPAVIRAVNNLSPTAVLRIGAILVITPGQSSPSGLPVVKAVYLTDRTLVNELAKTYSMDVAELRQFNALGPGDWLEANRWVIVRITP